jgi:hypothetical protein
MIVRYASRLAHREIHRQIIKAASAKAQGCAEDLTSTPRQEPDMLVSAA